MIWVEVSPRPTEVIIGENDYTFFFKFPEKASTKVTFQLQPKTLGKCQMNISSKETKLKEMDIYVYP
ncbi:MAG: hypothetical protein H0X62_11665 [Bacteroidetes bacterium]|nr:hypothetical protein [Bacteroidota bacterium]